MASQSQVMFGQAPNVDVRHLCKDGAGLLTDWLKAEPRLMSIIPEMMSLPPHLLVAGSRAGDLYLEHLRECTECKSPATHAS